MIDPATQRYVQAHLHDDPTRLALKKSQDPGVDTTLAMRQISGWQVAEKKIPTWAANPNICYPPHISMEQCSSEQTARYKARLLCPGEKLADLSGGFGVDCAFLASAFRQTWFVEPHTKLCNIAQHNFACLQLSHVNVLNTTAQEALQQLQGTYTFYIDPARRDHQGRKVHALEQCSPNVPALMPAMLPKAKEVLVKCSPMADLRQLCAQLPHVAELHVVCLDSECKEVLCLIRPYYTGEPIITVAEVGKVEAPPFCFTAKEEQEACAPIAPHIAQFLYEPSAGILKSGAFKTVACRYGLQKLHPNTHLYTAAHALKEFPGRVFRVIETLPLNPQKAAKSLQHLQQANITVRNAPLTAAELKKRLKLKDGGEHYLFATTLQGEKRQIIVCQKAE